MATDVNIPEMGESVSEVTVLEWLKQDGDYVEKDEPFCVLETDKANVDLPAPVSGVLRHLRKLDEALDVGQLLARIDESATAPVAATPAQDVAPAPTPIPVLASPDPAAGPNSVPDSVPESSLDLAGLSPAVRRLVEEHHVDAKQIRGTGRGGRLIKQDVLAYLKEREHDERDRSRGADAVVSDPLSALATQPVARDSSSPPSVDGQRREPMSRLRKRVASRLVDAQRTTALLTTFNEVDLSQMMALRKRHKQAFQDKYGVSLGLMSFFSRAVVVALQEIPAVNASIDGDDIVYHDYIHLGIAVSTERGLLVPVLRDVDAMSMAQIETQIKRLALAARDNKLTLDELSGGTFSITNGGVFGSMMSTPILTPPQSGILGMHAIKERPIAIDGQVVIRPMMYTALTYDHRLVDGQQSVRFLVRLKELLEDPARLMLEV